MNKQVFRISTLAILLGLLAASTSRTFTHLTSLTASVSQPANGTNDPGGGDPDPTDPGGNVAVALHLS